MAVDPEVAEVKAAGGVVWRPAGGTIAIAVVHRPRYDDWSLPKGKLDPGESWEDAARREVEEEIGIRARLGEELEPVAYHDRKGRAKVVRYWLMEPEHEHTFTPNPEVDELRWLAPPEAVRVLTYPHDAELVEAAAQRLA